jgi:hypothetical protein
MILLISIFHIVRITGLSHWCPALYWYILSLHLLIIPTKIFKDKMIQSLDLLPIVGGWEEGKQIKGWEKR